MTIRQRIDTALAELKNGLNPFVATQMEAVYRGDWVARAKQSVRDGSFTIGRDRLPIFDVSALCNILLDNWQSVFAGVLGKTEYQLVHRIRTLRNEFAHQREISADSAIGDFEAIIVLLNAVGAGSNAITVQRLKEETGRERYGTDPPIQLVEPETVRVIQESEKALVPWRDVVTPHADVRTRRFVNAEFAANLYDVWQRTQARQVIEGDEYADPRAFFDRTFLTSGLVRLLRNAALRLAGRGGEPVVELQTSFGGGKTHALLALYHLTSGAPFSDLHGVAEMLQSDGITSLPPIRRVVLVGTQMQAGQPVEKSDGTVVRTMWGELAYQLGGAEAFATLSGSDKTSTNPGAALGELLRRYSPCVILIDEWVAYARQLGEDTALSGGTFETQFTFAQTLTEAVKATPQTMLVLTLPMSDVREEPSDIEVGGIRGREALRRLRNVIGRSQANWQPADINESYAIVRRRLFEPMQPDEEKRRDRAIGVLHKYYREREGSFPRHASDPSYKQRLADCYPMHPELFELLYKEWGSLEQFQRTRGVLRLMAAAIHTLWSGNDRAPLIMPGTLPLEDNAVKSDLTRYLGNQNQWDAVLMRDVLGTDSVARRIDEKDRRLGRHNAAQRVAKMIFLATAPQHAEGTSGRGGIDLRSIRLGCVFPGEQITAFDDAVRRLSDEGAHLNSDGTHYWFGLPENLNQRVSRMAAQFEQEPHVIDEQMVNRLAEWQREPRGLFARIQHAQKATLDVPDEPVVRLVVLGPDVSHRRGRENSSARELALQMTLKCGEADRKYKNCLLFLAADEARLDELRTTTARWLAWKKILDDRVVWADLTGAQQESARQQSERAAAEVKRQLSACWIHGFVPEQAAEVGAPITLCEYRVEGGSSVAEAFSRKLASEGKLIEVLGGVNLRLELDRKGIWRDQNHIGLRELSEDFARYPYLIRLKDESVLANSVRDGVAKTTWDVETFAYADGYDEATGVYRGLVAGSTELAQIDMVNGLIVKPQVAAAQLARSTVGGPDRSGTGSRDSTYGPGLVDSGEVVVAGSVRPRHFYQRVTVSDPTMLPRVVNKLATDIIGILAAKGADVEVSIEVTAGLDAGIDQNLEDRLRSNSAAHNFPSPEFNA
jgi:predicted AAA+ superfamily ATPase